jgi:hypothetical protein
MPTKAKATPAFINQLDRMPSDHEPLRARTISVRVAAG